jgi:O-antigen/teichoic acid export membrane protein
MASAIVLLPFYISLLPTAVYGALSLYLAFALFIQVLVAYSFDASLYVHYHEFKNDKHKLSVFVSSAFVLMVLIGVGVGLIMTLLGQWVFALVFDDARISFFPFGIMSVVVGFFQAIFKVYSNLMQSREKPETFFWSNLLLFALIALLTIAGLYMFPATLMGPIGGRVIAGAVLTAWVFYRVLREYGFHVDFSALKSSFSFNHYLFIYQLQQWVINNIDRFIMVLFLPVASVGIYDFAMKCLVVIEYIMNGLNSSFFPKVVSTLVAQQEKRSTVELNRYYNVLTAIVMVLISGAILTLPWIVEWMDTRQGYDDAVKYFPFIAVIYILKSIRLYFASPYAALKYTRPLPVFYMIISAVKIGGLFLLIESWGIMGVVASSLLSAGIDIVLLRFGITGKFVFEYNKFKLLVAPLALMVVVLVAEPLLAAQFGWQLHLFYAGMVLVLLLWFYRNEWRLLKLNKTITKG